MLRLLLSSLRRFLRALRNLRRGRGKAPDYVVFTLAGSYPELRPRPAEYWKRRFFPPQPSLQELAEQFHSVAGDPRPRGVVLHLRDLHLSGSQRQTLRSLIEELRRAGKQVIAWSQQYDHLSFQVACAAGTILLQPGGRVDPLGLHRSFLFLGDAFQRLGLKADIVQISPYKAAADLFTRNRMSDAMRENLTWLMDAAYGELLGEIAAGRKIDEARAEALVDGSPYTDLQALTAAAVDARLSEEELPSFLAIAGKPAQLAPWREARRRLLVPAPGQPRADRGAPPSPGPAAEPRHGASAAPPFDTVAPRGRRGKSGRYVALLRVEGDIINGRSQQPPFRPPLPLPFLFNARAGDLSVVEEARRVLRDERAAALVVAIESRGGSATAAEAICAALTRVAARKPLVAYLGGIAASGGYYVAAPAHWIVAQPGTITGSIGVLAGKLSNAGFLDQLLVRWESLSRGRHAALHDPVRPFTEAERRIMEEEITSTYELFLARVAAARTMTRDAVDAVGGGRVWSGRQALGHGLIDELGRLDAALAKARHLAGLPETAPLRAVKPSSRPLAPPTLPQPDLSAMLKYAAEGVRLFSQARVHCLWPVLWHDPSSLG
ncbi:MAG: signal peptide peptidase SppA [Candidatus Tectomicrobia bacterium]|nr:signal peptide peptidase SppA [Candidatus Tectomicrobia bacterium]